MQLIAVEVFICLHVYLFTCLFTCLFVCVENRTCLRIAISAYCLNIFGSVFGVLFCLLDKKLILRSKKHLTKYEHLFVSVEGVRKFPQMDKEETSFFLENCTLAYSEIFLDNYLFMRPEN